MRPTGIHPEAIVGEPPEHRDWHVGMPYTQPVIDPTAYVGALCTIDGGMPYTHYGEEQLSLPPTTIGARTFAMKRTHVGHNARIGEDCELGAGVVICGMVRIGDRVRIGGNAWVRPFVQIGDDARIGGGAVVVKDVPDGAVVAGNPAKPLIKGREAKARGQEPEHDSHFHLPVPA